MELLVNQKLRTANTHAVEHIQNVGKELNEVDGASKAKMPKMSRAAVIRLPTTAARLAIVQNTHARIKQATNTGLTPIIRPGVCHLYHRALLDFLWPKDAELDSHHGLNLRIWAMNSGRHLSSEL
jgi:hypothetical protein